MLKKKKDKEAVEEFCSIVREKLGRNVKSIKLFGSKASGKDTPGSDIDLFIVVSEKTPEAEEAILNAAFEIDLKYDVYVSPRVVPHSVMKDPLWKATPFLKNVRREGVLV